MYIPSAFRVTDSAKLAAFMNSNSFATLVSFDGDSPFASHLPIRYYSEPGEQGILIGHMARANPQWQHFQSDVDVLTIFQGPHSYISPSWYKTELSVPTWNYAAVHAYGVATILDDHERVISLLKETVNVYESSLPSPWPGRLPEEFRDKLIQAIVAFEIRVTRLEGKFKLGQNRTQEDIRGVYQSLVESKDENRVKLAALMQPEQMIDLDEKSQAAT